MRVEMKLCLLLLYLFVLNGIVSGDSDTFDVVKYGARGDGVHDDSKAFLAAWKAACESSGAVKVLIPKANYMVGPVKFYGPCDKVKSITVYMKGYLKATTDLKDYGTYDWITFGFVEGLTLTGGGTFDGQGAASWSFNSCRLKKNCQVLPTNLKFVSLNDTVVRGITSLNSKFFHMGLVDCNNFMGRDLKITAPETSPNTDGIHIERSTTVSVYSSIIGTGDDCISIGHSSYDITISGVTCGPGHGISIGSLGRYEKEKDVNGIVVKDCTITETMNGVRIKTWEDSPVGSQASNMTFNNIVMHRVSNPIIIDQTYCPYTSCTSASSSRVKLKDIYFKNIRGTSTTPVAVLLECSKGLPCENVFLENIHLELSPGGGPTNSTCENVKPQYSGTQIPPPCNT